MRFYNNVCRRIYEYIIYPYIFVHIYMVFKSSTWRSVGLTHEMLTALPDMLRKCVQRCPKDRKRQPVWIASKSMGRLKQSQGFLFGLKTWYGTVAQAFDSISGASQHRRWCRFLQSTCTSNGFSRFIRFSISRVQISRDLHLLPYAAMISELRRLRIEKAAVVRVKPCQAMYCKSKAVISSGLEN